MQKGYTNTLHCLCIGLHHRICSKKSEKKQYPIYYRFKNETKGTKCLKYMLASFSVKSEEDCFKMLFNKAHCGKNVKKLPTHYVIQNIKIEYGGY